MADPSTSAERRKELESYKREIENFLKECPYKFRKPIEMYYIEPIASNEFRPTWGTVAEKIGNGELDLKLKVRINRFLRSTEK